MATSHIPIHPDDEPLVSQLASLQKMHDQICHLRTLPQRLMNPVSDVLRSETVPSIAGDAATKLYARIQKIAVEGLREVESFKESWLSDERQALWAHTRNSPCPQGSDVWRVDYIATLENNKAYDQKRRFEAAIANTDSREPEDILHDFCVQYPARRLESESPTAPIPFTIHAGGMRFRVVKSGGGDKGVYEVKYCHGSKTTHLQDGILKHLNQRRAKGNLEYLLNMISSYGDVTRRPCDKCDKLFDKWLTFPVMRNQTSNAAQDDEKVIRWEASHAHCA